MTVGGAVFMTLSVGFVFTLLTWCLRKVLTAPPVDDAGDDAE